MIGGSGMRIPTLVLVLFLGAIAFVAAVLLLQKPSDVGASRAQAHNQLKQLGLAMAAYHDAFKHLPAHAIYSKDGKPLLSWRVAMLPFVEQADLYKQFKLDESWDSDHNKQFIPKIPWIYIPVTTVGKDE